MTSNLINYLLQFGNLNTQQIQLIEESVTIVSLEKDEYFSEAGKIARQVAFVNNGILRVCYYDKEGKEQIEEQYKFKYDNTGNWIEQNSTS